jgi:hypothetical protein
VTAQMTEAKEIVDCRGEFATTPLSPSGAKAASLLALGGTAKAVPFPKTRNPIVRASSESSVLVMIVSASDEQRALLTNTECAENEIQYVVAGSRAGNFVERPQSCV